MKVKLSKDGRLVPGGSHPYWEANIDDWKKLREKEESVEIDVQKFSSLSSKEDKEKYENGEKGLLLNRLNHGIVQLKDSENLHEVINKLIKDWKFKDEDYFLHKNNGLEKVESSFGEKKLRDKIKREGGEN